ncbi:MAG: CDP-glucose 4,6-dehydratase, partial [Synergistaceae bacterium]|nr:CDP-glucose 4,6-dehydratase [Synergistaceae bacterium]
MSFVKIDPQFWNGKTVFLTGHTGFKGSWLALWLLKLGARVHGYSLEPPTNPNMFDIIGIKSNLSSHIISDVRNSDSLKSAISETDPDIVIHMAAQPIVRDSYRMPAETYAVNVMGTINVLEAVRAAKCVRAVVCVTTDKCYENKEWLWGYRENEPLGGHDPYSSSKACAEIAVSSWRSSFFEDGDEKLHRAAIATARAGNVIGGGDWANDRLVPDCIRAIVSGEKIIVRSPYSIRP